MDFLSTNSFLLMEKSLGFLWTKQAAILDNIANAETPNYKAKVVTFEETIQSKLEAARAGTAGKGFAVVADEVRNLASKSDEAAKATKELIEGSIAAVAEGSQVVERVTESLEQTSIIAGNVTAKVDIVVEAVEHQNSAITQVTEGIDQISLVVQTNSATAQQSAAASEELSAEASCLKELVERFVLART